ncbi:hypothetical protein FHS96_005167 [Sphingomonas zeicaulis]|uniref:DUF4178 domain-containing protein n=1 Tax=Sphingomonas zeicaulis TaxID=1632740 RepID=UPI003D1EEC9F
MVGAAPPIAADAPAPPVKPLACPNCGGTIELRAAGYSTTLVCQYCSSVLDVTNPDVRVIECYNEASRRLAIPLGTRGTLQGIEWEAIGYLRRSEGGSYPWDEYLLFNPYHGYRWLMTDGRGWTLGRMLTVDPGNGAGSRAVEGHVYAPFFGGGRAQVDYVLGEFYWRVKVGETVDTADYVRPGWMLSFEGNEQERNWTVGELLDPRKTASAFGLTAPRPWRPGGPPPLPHQISPYGRAVKFGLATAFAGFVALLLVLILFGGSSDVRSFDLDLQTAGGPMSRTVGPVTLRRPYQAVTISAAAPRLENAWVDLDYRLVDRKTQRAFEAYGVAERYSGRDSDGAWTEGSRGATTKIASVPAGDYDLVVDANATRWTYAGSDRVYVTVTVKPGGRFWSNFFLALILLVLPLFWLAWHHLRFEGARQGESDQGSGFSILSGDDE